VYSLKKSPLNPSTTQDFSQSPSLIGEPIEELFVIGELFRIGGHGRFLNIHIHLIEFTYIDLIFSPYFFSKVSAIFCRFPQKFPEPPRALRNLFNPS